MLTVFQVCFFVGIGLALLSFIMGHLCDFMGIDGLHFDLFSVDFALPSSPVLYVLAATVFGGLGWILMKAAHPLPLALIIIIAAAAGFLAAFLFNLGIIRPLRKAQNTSAPETEELIGRLARVTEHIYEHGFGEITYVVNGNSYSAPARSTTGEALKKGSEVSICWIEDHVFYVANIET